MLSIREAAGEHVIELHRAEGATDLPRSYAEYTVAALVLRTQAASNTSWHPKRVDFCFPAPADTREHERLLACPLRFGVAPTAVVLSDASWHTPVHEPDPMLLGVLEAHARSMMNALQVEPPVVLLVRRALVDSLHGGRCDLPSVARRAGASERTLQRRLSEAGVSFAELLDQTRRSLAESYLQQADVAIGEVSFLLGYSEQSAFSRAFKRWTGASPASFRRAAAST